MSEVVDFPIYKRGGARLDRVYENMGDVIPRYVRMLRIAIEVRWLFGDPKQDDIEGAA